MGPFNLKEEERKIQIIPDILRGDGEIDKVSLFAL
jgi:hypothetical protein